MKRFILTITILISYILAQTGFEIAQKIASILSGGDDLKGLRGFWYYLAGSSAELANKQLNKKYIIHLINNILLTPLSL